MCFYFSSSSYGVFSLLDGRRSRTERAEMKRELADSHAVTQQLCSCLGVIRPGQETDSRAARRCLPAPCYFKPPSSVTAVGVSAKEVAPTPPPSCLTDSAALCPRSLWGFYFFIFLAPSSRQAGRSSAVLGEGGCGGLEGERESKSERLVTLPLDYTDAW